MDVNSVSWQAATARARSSAEYRRARRIRQSSGRSPPTPRARAVPKGNSLIGMQLQFTRRSAVSPREDSFPRSIVLRAGKGALVVVELDVRLIDQRDVEAEGEVAVRALREDKTRAPAA